EAGFANGIPGVNTAPNRSVLIALSASRPVFDLQALDTGELRDIVGQEDEVPRLGLAGNEHIIGTDGGTLACEDCSDLARHSGILRIEIKNGEIGKEQS